MEPPALSPVSIDRRTVSPTTRPTPARRMHGWPAVADLTSGRPIRISLVQAGAAPTAQAHCKLSQHTSQQSDSFLCSLKTARRADSLAGISHKSFLSPAECCPGVDPPRALAWCLTKVSAQKFPLNPPF